MKPKWVKHRKRVSVVDRYKTEEKADFGFKGLLDMLDILLEKPKR